MVSVSEPHLTRAEWRNIDFGRTRKPILLLMQWFELGPEWCVLKLGARKRMEGIEGRKKGTRLCKLVLELRELSLCCRVSGGATGTISVL